MPRARENAGADSVELEYHAQQDLALDLSSDFS
jgi:hypothetical protein